MNSNKEESPQQFKASAPDELVHKPESNELAVGMKIKPFENLRELKAPEGGFPDEESHEVARFEFSLRGAHGHLALVTDATAENIIRLNTPLGEVQVHKTISSEGQKFQVLPLAITMHLTVTSEEQLHAVSKLAFVAQLGDSLVAICCRGANHSYFEDRPQDIAYDLDQEGFIELETYELYDTDQKIVMLPFDPSIISEIEFKLVELDQVPEDPTEVPAHALLGLSSDGDSTASVK